MIIKIKNKLYNDVEKLQEILEELGCHNIRIMNNQFRFGIDEHGSGTSNVLNIETLHYTSFSKSVSGDIITLVSHIKEISVGESIKWLANKLGVKKIYEEPKQVNLPFMGFWKSLSKHKYADDEEVKTYSMTTLNKYLTGANTMFIKDGISAITQEKFNIGLDIETNRVTIPWIDINGELIGVIGRLFKEELSSYESKYLPVIAFNKGKSLYGLYQNYNNILDTGIIIITESEKSTLKGCEFGMNNVVSLGGNNISSRQSSLIKSLHVDVIIALDQGIEIDHCMAQAKKCKIQNVFFSNTVYIMDMSGLPEKSCIFDLDRDTIHKAFAERLIKVE